MDREITAEELRVEILRRKYIQLLKQPDIFPSLKNWEFIISNRLGGEIAPLLYHKYLVALSTPTIDRVESHQLAISHFPKYLASLSYEDALNALYSDTDTLTDESVKLAERNNLFSASRILKMIDRGELQKAVRFLMIFKPVYRQEDYVKMLGLLRRLKSLPEIGSVELNKSFFASSMRYICPDGHSNGPDCVFCEQCGKDKYGLTQEMYQSIKVYENMVNVLGEMFHTS